MEFLASRGYENSERRQTLPFKRHDVAALNSQRHRKCWRLQRFFLLTIFARNLVIATVLVPWVTAFSTPSQSRRWTSVEVNPFAFESTRMFIRAPQSNSRLFSMGQTDVKLASDEAEWKAMLAAFKMYKAAYGDLKVPQKFVVPSLAPWPEIAWGLRLGKCVGAIRSTGKYVQDENRRKLLDDMGFVWRLRSARQKEKEDKVVSFDQIFSAIEIYRAEVQPGEGSLNIPANFVVPDCDPWPETTRGLPLGRKLSIIRSRSFLAANPGAEEKLNSVGVPLDGKVAANDARFQLVYDALSRYKDIYGDLLVPQPFVVPDKSQDWPEQTWGLRLGARVNAIRSQGTFVKNNPERKQLLDDLEFIWTPSKSDRTSGRVPRNLDKIATFPPGEMAQPKYTNDAKQTSIPNPAFAPGLDDKVGFSNSPLQSVAGMGQDSPYGLEPGTKLPEAPAPMGNDGQFKDEIKQPRLLQDSLKEAKARAIAVGIIEEVPDQSRYRKAKREKNIPWFNDDFGDEFVFEDVVEGLRIYKSIYGDFSNLTEDGFIVPSVSDEFSGIDGKEAMFGNELSSRAAAAMASFDAGRNLDVPDILEGEEDASLFAVETDIAVSTEASLAEWPEHLGGMALGSLAKRIRDGSLEVKHIPERKRMLDALDFDWGDPKYFLDVAFEKAMCAMYAYYLVRGDMFVRGDFVMPDEDPWPRALAGYELGKAVHRIRELQNFMEAYHSEKVSLLRMIDFVWFPTLALPLDPNEPEMTSETLRLSALGHPDYAKIRDIPMGLPDKILADGPFFETDDPKLWWRKWHNWDYVKDYWYQQGRRDNAFVLRGMGYPQMADEHEAKYGPGLFQLINETMTEFEEGMEGRETQEVNTLVTKLMFFRQEITDCSDIHPEDLDELLDRMDKYLEPFLLLTNGVSTNAVSTNAQPDAQASDGEYDYKEESEYNEEATDEEDQEGEWIDEDMGTFEEDDFDVASQLGLDVGK